MGSIRTSFSGFVYFIQPQKRTFLPMFGINRLPRGEDVKKSRIKILGLIETSHVFLRLEAQKRIEWDKVGHNNDKR